MTQPIYDKELIIRVAEAVKDIPVPVFIGIMPLASGRNAEYLHNEVPGIQLSARFVNGWLDLKAKWAALKACK